MEVSYYFAKDCCSTVLIFLVCAWMNLCYWNYVASDTEKKDVNWMLNQ